MDYQFPKKQYNISNSTKDKVEACKRYIEKKYTEMIKLEQERREEWQKLINKMNEANLKPEEQNQIRSNVLKAESTILRKKRTKITTSDFEPLAIIGRGAFGEVRVCRFRKTGEILAVKKMKKSEMLAKNQLAHIRAERDILSQQNIWTVDLKMSFQDEKYLYLVMEYMVGGDLMTLLMKKDILSEEEAKFYIAELVLAVDSIHKMNYIHRDLKPDNILIDRKGHLKLSDFGLCKYTEIKPKIDFGVRTNQAKPILSKISRKRQLALSTVGTPDYIAPEVFSQQGYTEIVDWWSVGVMLFEMVVGYPPFFSDDPQTTCQKILNWQISFQIPEDMHLSPQCIDLIRRLIADPSERLGINGIQEIKIHPFFQGVDWKKIRDKPSPYIPEVKSEIDTQNFEKFEEEEPWNFGGRRTKKDNFQGYSYNRQVQNEQSPIKKALEEIDQVKKPVVQPAKTFLNGSPHRKYIDPSKKPTGFIYIGPRSNSPVNKLNTSGSTGYLTGRGSQVNNNSILKILNQFKKKDSSNNSSFNNSRLPNLSTKRSVREQSPKYYYQQ
ncbi:hypothetical protein pb186bvf_018898 [Paramecium bursaria]